MRRSTPFAAASLALLIVLSGCSVGSTPTPTATAESPTASPTATVQTPTPSPTATGETTTSTPTATSTPTPTATPDPNETVTVEGEELPVDATRIFQRVESLMDADVTPPTVMVTTDPTPGTRHRDLFVRRMGLSVPESERNEINSTDPVLGTTGLETVILGFPDGDVDDTPEREIELTLVHEFVHIVQHQRGIDEHLEATVPRHVQNALVEGGAAYVTHAYAERYGVRNADGRMPLADRERDYESSAEYDRYWRGWYYYGSQYFDHRVDDPADVWRVYEDPPTTMEQVLHPETAEPPTALSVSVDAPAWSVDERRQYGELMTRTVLETEIPTGDAVAAAHGWGNDSLVHLRNGATDGHVWVLRWDDAGEADEFETALREFVDGREDDSFNSFRVVRVSPKVVALVVGPDGFVEAATVGGTEESVTVQVEEG